MQQLQWIRWGYSRFYMVSLHYPTSLHNKGARPWEVGEYPRGFLYYFSNRGKSLVSLYLMLARKRPRSRCLQPTPHGLDLTCGSLLWCGGIAGTELSCTTHPLHCRAWSSTAFPLLQRGWESGVRMNADSWPLGWGWGERDFPVPRHGPDKFWPAPSKGLERFPMIN